MCGIVGIVDIQGRGAKRELLERMNACLVHRGPDDEGYYLDGSVGLGQRRLSIIDLSSGRQPMSNADGTVWVTFNGEIYNFQELRDRLAEVGHKFVTHSDTEVIVHAYEEFGEACVKRLRGMFAFALWDQRNRQLLLARDRVGKKPLFYARVDGQFVFASELQALLQHPGIRREVDLTAIDDYLTYGYIPTPKTAFVGVYKLRPAHYLKLSIQHGAWSIAEERYWQLEYTPKLDLNEEDAAERLLEVLTEAIRLRLVADVPLGALLSGGIDSSIVVALMSRLTRKPVKTFSIGFAEQAFNELPYARLVAQRYGTDHHELIVRPQALEVLPTLVRHYGEPYADSSAIPTYYLARVTREHVTVALNGDGGDECLAGYERYLGSALAERYRQMPTLLRKGLIEPLSSLIPDSLPSRHRLRQAKRFLQVATQPFAPRYVRWVTYCTPEQKQHLYTPEFQKQLAGREGEAWLLGQFDALRQDGMDALDALLAVDVHSYLPYDLLVKMDIATMANSLEARSPFLDHQVMEFCARLPSHFKLRGRTSKYLLKKVGQELLPPQNLRRRKMGFGVPVGYWLRGELRHLLQEVLLSPRALTRGFFRAEALHQLVRAHLDGTRDYSFQLWALLWLELWNREFVD